MTEKDEEPKFCPQCGLMEANYGCVSLACPEHPLRKRRATTDKRFSDLEKRIEALERANSERYGSV